MHMPGVSTSCEDLMGSLRGLPASRWPAVRSITATATRHVTGEFALPEPCPGFTSPHTVS